MTHESRCGDCDNHGDALKCKGCNGWCNHVPPLVPDTVNHPSHYTQGGVECIEAIKASMTDDEYRGYLKGNAIKYIWRYQQKGKPGEDLAKAIWYLDRLKGEVTHDENASQ